MSDAERLPVRVLLADAEQASRTAMGEAIAEAHPGAAVDTARNGRELFDRLQQHTYDVLVLDTILSDVDVPKLMKVLAVVRARRAMRLILLVDRLKPTWTQLGQGLQAYDVLLKPLRHEVVVRTCAACFESLRPRALLLADASVRARRLVQKIVDESQFAAFVTEAETGRLALRHIRRHVFDLALVDFALPDMPALEVASRILARGDDVTQVLMMGDDPDRCRGLAVFGIQGFLEKPFGALLLDDCLHRTLGLWRPYLSKALQPTAA